MKKGKRAIIFNNFSEGAKKELDSLVDKYKSEIIEKAEVIRVAQNETRDNAITITHVIRAEKAIRTSHIPRTNRNKVLLIFSEVLGLILGIFFDKDIIRNNLILFLIFLAFFAIWLIITAFICLEGE